MFTSTMSSASFNNIPTKIVLLGNPGVGKSTIHNTLLGRISSQSGVSIGKGLTKNSHTSRSGAFVCVDTPGLDDIYNRKNAAREISVALRGPCRVKLVFVTTLEAGRVRCGDIAALATILDGLSHVVGNVDDKYLLIINKCEDSVYKALSDDATKLQSRTGVLAPFSALGGVSRFALLRCESCARGKANVLLQKTNVERLRDVIEATPTIKLPYNPILHLDISDFEQNKKEIEEDIKMFYSTFESALRRGASGREGQSVDSENCKPCNLDTQVDGERRVGRLRRGIGKFTELMSGLQPWLGVAEMLCSMVLMFL